MKTDQYSKNLGSKSRKTPRPHKKLDRRHYTYLGKPKRSYNTELDALEFCKDKHYQAYLCPVCNKWHIGYVKNKADTEILVPASA